MPPSTPLPTLLSHALVAYTIELDNEFEHRFAQAGGGARVASLVMWSNFLRFVGDGITVGELAAAAGLQKPRVLSTLGGLERWRYIYIAPEPTGPPPMAKRDGWGSARGLRETWTVRLTPAGRKAEEIWGPLPGQIERRWEERFDAGDIDELRCALQAIVALLGYELPEYLPIVGSTNGMAADLPLRESREDTTSRLHLSALLSQALLAYTLDFENESALSLPASANIVRVLDETGVPMRDLPLLSGVSREATSMALTYLAKADYAVVEGASAATKLARLTPEGRELQAGYGRLQAEVEQQWVTRFGAQDVRRLRSSLGQVLGKRDLLARGLEPYPDGWRASKPYLEHTEAVLADPSAALPHYPMVLHRGGWPDGS